MPVQFLSEVDRDRLSRFPSEIPQQDLKDFFWLSEDDRQETKRQRGEHNWLGFALQLCCLRYLGFFPSNSLELPQEVVQFVASQLQVNSNCFRLYGQRPSTQRKHQRQIQAFLGYRRATEVDILSLEQWLLERALEHDLPMRLLELACDYLKRHKLVRLKPVRLARMGSTMPTSTIFASITVASAASQDNYWRRCSSSPTQKTKDCSKPCLWSMRFMLVGGFSQTFVPHLELV